MMSALRQLSALLWKNWLIRIRNPCASLLEFVVPIIYGLMIVGFPSEDNKFHSKRIDENMTYDSYEYNKYEECDGNIRCKEKPYPLYLNKSLLKSERSRLSRDSKMIDLAISLNITLVQSRPIRVFYSPGNAFSRDLMQRFQDLSGANVTELNDQEYVIKELKKFGDKFGQFDEDYEPFGFIFEALPTNGSTIFDYRFVNLRDFEESMKRVYGSKVHTNDKRQIISDHWLYNYRYRFCKFQIILNEALLNKLTKDSRNNEITIESWVEKTNPKFVNQREPSSFMTSFLLVYSFFIMCVLLTQRLVNEKSKRIREMLRIMTVSDLVFWFSHFFNCFALILIDSILFTLLSIIFGTSFFSRVNPIIFFTVFNLFGIQLILFFMVFSVFFDKPIMAKYLSTVAFGILLVMMVVSVNLKNGLSLWIIVASLLPMTPLNINIELFLEVISDGSDFGFAQLFESTKHYKPITVFHVAVVQLLSIPLYCFLLWYLDAVVPTKYGITRPINFLCMPSFYRSPDKCNDEERVPIASKDNFETEPDNRKVAISLKKVNKVFNSGKGVHDMTFNIFEGQITALLGHNGAGKTTTMNLITGLYNPDSGVIKVNGHNIVTDTYNARRSLCLCPQVDKEF